MIKKLVIKNFQSHKETSLDFHEGLNVIVGSSDSGKSAIIRSFCWLNENRPLGDAFISNWARNKEACSVEVSTEQGVICRLRENEFNGYILNNTTELEAQGRDVPDPVVALINMSEINVSKQMDSPFLISSTSGEVARFFNKMVKLDLIDSLLSDIESDKRKNRSNLEFIQNDIDYIKKEVNKLTWLDSFKSKLDEAIILHKNINNKIEIKEKVELLTREYSKQTALLNTLSKILPKLENNKNKLTSIITAKNEKLNTYSSLLNIFHRYQSFKKVIDSTPDLNNIDKKIVNLGKRLYCKNDLCAKQKELNAIIKNNNILKKDISTLTIHLEELINELPNTCPYCGNKLQEEKSA
jgi:exonuclease SbcC